MQRREAFKKMSLFGLLGISGMAVMSCTANEKEIVKEVIPAVVPAVIPSVKSEREMLLINRQEMTFVDPENPTDHEYKHTPDITFGDTDEKGNVMVKITIGQKGIIHPALAEHWVDQLDVYVNDIKKIGLEFGNGGIRAFGNFYLAINKGDTIKAVAACNIHGIWQNSVQY